MTNLPVVVTSNSSNKNNDDKKKKKKSIRLKHKQGEKGMGMGVRTG